MPSVRLDAIRVFWLLEASPMTPADQQCPGMMRA
jgi:hypothetical protein